MNAACASRCHPVAALVRETLVRPGRGDRLGRPADGDKYFAPPYRSSLYGTELWDRLTEAQRIEVTKHEVAGIASVGIWFETILMQMLVRHAYDPSAGLRRRRA